MIMVMMMMMMMMHVVQMSANLPKFLSTLAYYVSSVGDVMVQLYGHVALYADVIVDWLLSHVFVYVMSSVISSYHIQQLITIKIC